MRFASQFRGRLAIIAGLIFSAAAGNAKQPTAEIPAFNVDFSDCAETIGIGLVSTPQARALIPAEVRLPGDTDAVTPLVVRTVNCDEITVAGAKSKSGTIVQIGLLMFPRDSTAFLDMYGLLFYTTEPKLAHALKKIGVDAQHVPTIEYRVKRGEFSANVRKPGDPRVKITGPVAASTDPAGVFIANWWHSVPGGMVRMNTSIPEMTSGTATLLLTTEGNSELGRLIGGNSFGFPLLEQFNTFASAQMVTRLLP